MRLEQNSYVRKFFFTRASIVILLCVCLSMNDGLCHNGAKCAQVLLILTTNLQNNNSRWVLHRGINGGASFCSLRTLCNIKQGHHHNCDQATRRPHTLCSMCFHSFGALAKGVRLLMVSLHSQPMCFQMCSIDIFVDFQPTNSLKGGLLNPLSLRVRGRGIGMVPINSLQMDCY